MCVYLQPGCISLFEYESIGYLIGNKTKKSLAERGFDPRTSGLWAQHASTAPLCLDIHLMIGSMLLNQSFSDAIRHGLVSGFYQFDLS